jgi:hypothetical protein
MHEETQIKAILFVVMMLREGDQAQKGHLVDALVLGGDEGRSTLR